MWVDYASDRIVPISGIATEADFRHSSAERQLVLHLLTHTFAPLTKFCAAGFIPNLETGLVAIIPPAFGALAMILWRRKSDPAMERTYHLSPFTHRRLSHTRAYGRGTSNSMPKNVCSDCASPSCASGVFLRY